MGVFQTKDDEYFIRRALDLAQGAMLAGDVPIGAVLVSGELIVEAKNEKEARRDPTAHAEMLALREAARMLGRWRLSGATVYITKEPCVMCAGALIAARVKRVVFGCRDPKAGASGSVFAVLGSAKVNHYIDVKAGVLEEEASRQLQEFFKDRRH